MSRIEKAEDLIDALTKKNNSLSKDLDELNDKFDSLRKTVRNHLVRHVGAGDNMSAEDIIVGIVSEDTQKVRENAIDQRR